MALLHAETLKMRTGTTKGSTQIPTICASPGHAVVNVHSVHLHVLGQVMNGLRKQILGEYGYLEEQENEEGEASQCLLWPHLGAP